MNRGKKLKQMKRFINKYGSINEEYKRPPDKNYPPYRKGSYFAFFISDEIGCAVGDVDKYHVYKAIVKEIKEDLKIKMEYLNNKVR